MALYGLVQLVRDTFNWTHSINFVSIVALILGVVFTAPFVYHSIIPSSLRQLGHGRLRADRICTQYKKTVAVSPNLTARVTVERTLVFLEEPDAQDLFDSYSIDPKLEITSFNYDSNDATEIGRRRIAANRISIFWQPRTTIRRLVPYKHNDAWTPPVKYDQPANFSSFSCIEKTGIVVITIQAPFDIEYVCLFRRPSWRQLKSDEAYLRYAFSNPDFRWGFAEILDDRRTILWQMYEPPVGKTYDCIFFRVGGVDYWRQRLELDNSL